MSGKKNDSIPNIKVILLGEMAVGKTNLINAYCDRDFIPHTCPTNSPEFSQRKIKIENKKYFIDLWDTAGQERYHSVAIKVIKQVQGIIVVFDITKKETFKSVANWLQVIDDNFTDVSIILFGNKCDMEENREVTKEEATKFAMEKNIT